MGIARFIQTVKFFGGLKETWLQLVRRDAVKMGTLIGEDKFGNKYYEDNYFFFGRSRWVQFSDQFGYDYDASHIPAEWYGWIHYKTDLPPHVDPTRPKYKWMEDSNENMTGTNQQYVPYSTTKPKIEAWNPKSKRSTV